MEKLDGISVKVARLYAHPEDDIYGPSWRDLALHSPWVTIDHMRRLHALHPQTALPAQTIITGNEGNWTSFSDYLVEMACDDAAQKIGADMVEGRAIYHRESDIRDAEAREDQRSVNLFVWVRPLKRVATHVDVELRGHLQEDHRLSLERVFGALIITRETGNAISFLAAGTPQDVEGLVESVLTPLQPRSRPW